jgi:hypothetical protein
MGFLKLEVVFFCFLITSGLNTQIQYLSENKVSILQFFFNYKISIKLENETTTHITTNDNNHTL